MTKIKASTQEHLDIENIHDDLVILKSGNAAAVLETTAVNFNLLSEREQDAIIEAYGGLLNSLSFPIQIVVRSKRLDISTYLAKLEEKKEKVGSLPSKKHIDRYLTFVKNLTQKNGVLNKKFYVIVPYQEVIITLENPLKRFLANLRGRGELPQPEIDSKELIERATPKLNPRIDHLIKQFARIGTQARRLKTNELIKLFYEIYNG